MSDDDSETADPFEQAVALHEAGAFEEAIAIYRELLEAEGEDAALCELLGTALGAIGDTTEALIRLDRAVELGAAEEHSTARLQRGLVREVAGDLSGAAEDLRSELESDPKSAATAEHLARVLVANGQGGEAQVVLAAAIDHEPRRPSLRTALAASLLEDGRIEAAERELDAAASLDPQDETMFALRIRVLAERGEANGALEIARRAATLHPGSATSRLNLLTALVSTDDRQDADEALDRIAREGDTIAERDRVRLTATAEMVLGRFESAIDRLERWCRSSTDDAEAMAALGVALRRDGRPGEAVSALKQAIAIAPRRSVLGVELGRAQLAAGDADAAIESLRRARELGGGSPALTLEMVNALKQRGLAGQAIAAADEGLLQGPAPALRTARAMLLHEIGRHREAVSESAEVANDAEAPDGATTNHLFGLNNPDHVSEREIFEAHRRLGGQAPRGRGSEAIASRVGFDGHDRTPTRPLRVGFVSGDLKAHSVAWFLAPLLRGLDSSRVATTCYSNTAVEDAVSERLRAACGAWRSIRGQSDVDAAAVVRADAIDVLVDLSGHTAGHRLGVFRQRSAPVQMTWLGYPNTTGVPEIDWRLVDGLTDPAPLDGLATESLIRMRSPFLCFDREVISVPIAERPSRPLVFGSFNSTAKLSDRCLSLWSRLLAAVPDGRLLLKSRAFEDELVRAEARGRLERLGVDRSRLEFRGFSLGLEAHHRAYADMDIALDTCPYHGTTTTCEALWNGVPVISRVGDAHRARVGLTLLQAVGLGSLACQDDDAFVEAGASLAADGDRRRHLHATLRDRMRSGPLCDERGFATRFEEAIRYAWATWCRGDAPQGAMLEA
ncbi:MAG: tetratricopeptide repeat protein [Planctomycetota bacterium]|jgi:predicted O-linked N-acetylglucosamine transferase (SPINDLY family)